MSTDLRQWWHLPRFKEDDMHPKELYRPQHVGLYLDRCLPLPYVYEQGDRYDDKKKKALKDEKAHRITAYDSAIEALKPKADGPAIRTYRACYDRWLKALRQAAPLRAVRVIELETTTRLLLHPSANQSITDGAVLMHHTYGAPYLPGSGLKGLARAQARREGHRDTVIRALFGNDREAGPDEAAGQNPDQAALVRFLDALWIPEAPEVEQLEEWSPLSVDVITPHHSAYYTGTQPPGDWQQPVPTQRLTLAPGARFCVILEGCQGDKNELEPWLHLAEDLLVMAVAELGFGAYTRAGFGRMRDPDDRAAHIAAARRGEEAEEEKIKAKAEEVARKAKAEAEEVARKATEEAAEAERRAAIPWVPAFIIRDPGSWSLKIRLTTLGGKTVSISGERGRALLAAMPAERAAKLTKRNELTGEAQLDTQPGPPLILGLR